MTFYRMTDLERRWNIGYDLDCAGDEFGLSTSSFTGALGIDSPLLFWDDPSFDNFPFGCHLKQGRWTQTLLLISPYDKPDWPTSFEYAGMTYTLLSVGDVNESEHDCICHGKLIEWTGAAGDPHKPLNACWLRAEALEQGVISEMNDPLPALVWKCTGNGFDRPYPECNRCSGDGTVVSPSGYFAWYELTESML